jgi:hypothetical protein
MSNKSTVQKQGEILEEEKTLKDSQDKKFVPFERKTRMQKSTVNRTIRSLYKDYKKGLLRFDLAIQRNDVWTLDQRSNLIHSVLYGYPIPQIYALETSDEYLWFLDGKQRLTTLMSYISGDFALSKNTPAVYGENGKHEIAGCKFKDLPEDMQDVILDETIQIVKIKEMTIEERDEMFVRLNSGTSLSKIELTRAMHSELIETINQIAKHQFFADDIELTSSARNRFVDQEMILQIAMLMEEGKDKIKGFGSKHIRDYVLRLKDSQQVLSDKLVKKIESIADYLSMAVSDLNNVERKKALKKVHVPIIFYIAQQAVQMKLKPYIFGEFIRHFLIIDYSIESPYGQACQSSSTKKDSVITRINEMQKAFVEFVEKNNDNEEKVNYKDIIDSDVSNTVVS